VPIQRCDISSNKKLQQIELSLKMSSNTNNPQESSPLKQLEGAVLETIETLRQLNIMVENFHSDTEPHWFKQLFV